MDLADTDRRKAVGRVLPLLAAVAVLQACDSTTGTRTERPIPTDCSIASTEIISAALKDGIPALTDPEMEFPGGPGTAVWRQDDRVVGVVVDGQPIAVPLNIFWYHEIVNLNFGGEALAITHCPLTGSSLVFDRSSFGDVEFGVSGLLYRNNLMMFDRSGEIESLWPQMVRGARCGPQDGAALPMVAAIESTMGGWRTLHPSTFVVTSNTGFDRDYSTEMNPYGDYAEEDNPQVLFPVTINPSRPPKERALGVPDGDGGKAFPFGTLRELGLRAAVHETVGGQDIVVLWDDSHDLAMAYYPFAGGQSLTFTVDQTQLVDQETGSIWNAAGRAVAGSLKGEVLEPVSEAFVAYWFAWPSLYPNIQLWRGP